MKNRNLFIRIVAIVLCALMILGVLTCVISIYAAEPAASAATGSNTHMIWVILAGILAVAVAAACILTSRGKSEKTSGSSESDEDKTE